MSESERRLAQQRDPGEVRAMFERVSQRYDMLNHILSAGIDRRWRARAAELSLRDGMRRVLDVCGGTGDQALALVRVARKRRQQIEVVCSDFSPGMLALAARKFRGREVTIQPAIADAMCLPFVDGVFDLVTATFGVRNVVRLDTALGEMARVCRTGGRIAVLEFSVPRRQPIRGLYRAYFHGILPGIGQIVSRSRAYRYLPLSVDQFPPNPEFAAMLRASVGGQVEQHEFTFGIATLHIVEKRPAPTPQVARRG